MAIDPVNAAALAVQTLSRQRRGPAAGWPAGAQAASREIQPSSNMEPCRGWTWSFFGYPPGFNMYPLVI